MKSGQVQEKARIFRGWFLLTPVEQRAVLIVLFLILLGLGAKLWDASRETDRAGVEINE